MQRNVHFSLRHHLNLCCSYPDQNTDSVKLQFCQKALVVDVCASYESGIHQNLRLLKLSATHGCGDAAAFISSTANWTLTCR